MISAPVQRDPTEEFLQDNGIDMPTASTTVAQEGGTSITVSNRQNDITPEQVSSDVYTDNNPWDNTVIPEGNSEESSPWDNNYNNAEETSSPQVLPPSPSNNDNVIENTSSNITPEDEALFAPTTLEEAMNAAAQDNLLPENKIREVSDTARERFSSATWFKAIQNSTIILAGLGGIGSYVFYCLSKMNPRQIFIYDDDIVEMVNLAGQLYSKKMIGRKKVDAMTDLAKEFSDYYATQAIPQKFTTDTPPSDIMICGFDNMQARKTFFRSWFNYVRDSKHPEKCLFIDGRLAAEYFQVFCITGNDEYNKDRYIKEQLFDDRQAERTICSYKQTAYCANMIGSIIVNLYTNFMANTLESDVPRQLPYFTYYDAALMYFKTEN